MALKKLKMEREKEGFPITSLREIDTLLNAHHPNIVHVRVSLLYEGTTGSGLECLEPCGGDWSGGR